MSDKIEFNGKHTMYQLPIVVKNITSKLNGKYLLPDTISEGQ